jgi:hypothetical protein
MRYLTSATTVPLVWMLLGVSGCGGDPHLADRPQTAPVTGQVTYNGNPVEGATVTFRPAGAGVPGALGSGDGQGAVGQTDSNGRFQLTTFSPNDGAVPGQYQVSIRKLDKAEQPEVFDEDDPRYDPDVGTEETAPPKHLLPEKYANPQTSGLTETVSDGENEFQFDLTD